MAVIGLDAHQDVNRGHDESLNDQGMFDELRAILSAGGPPQSQLGSVSERGRAAKRPARPQSNPSQSANPHRTRRRATIRRLLPLARSDSVSVRPVLADSIGVRPWRHLEV